MPETDPSPLSDATESARKKWAPRTLGALFGTTLALVRLGYTDEEIIGAAVDAIAEARVMLVELETERQSRGGAVT